MQIPHKFEKVVPVRDLCQIAPTVLYCYQGPLATQFGIGMAVSFVIPRVFTNCRFVRNKVNSQASSFAARPIRFAFNKFLKISEFCQACRLKFSEPPQNPVPTLVPGRYFQWRDWDCTAFNQPKLLVRADSLPTIVANDNRPAVIGPGSRVEYSPRTAGQPRNSTSEPKRKKRKAGPPDQPNGKRCQSTFNFFLVWLHYLLIGCFGLSGFRGSDPILLRDGK